MDYKEYQRIIYSLAHQFARKGHNFDDLVGVGNMAFCRAVDNYDGSVKFSTFLYTCVKNAMIMETKTNWFIPLINIDVSELVDIPSHEDIERRILFLESLRVLSDESQEIIAHILSAPMLILHEARTLSQRGLRVSLFKFLRSNGYPIKKIRSSMKEIDLWFREQANESSHRKKCQDIQT